MGDMFTPKEVLTYVLGALVAVMLFVWRKWESDTKNRLKDHDEHFRKIDEALHQLQIQLVEQRHAQADIKEFQNDIKELETRMMRVEHVLTRIDERLGGKRRSTDPDPNTL